MTEQARLVEYAAVPEAQIVARQRQRRQQLLLYFAVFVIYAVLAIQAGSIVSRLTTFTVSNPPSIPMAPIRQVTLAIDLFKFNMGRAPFSLAELIRIADDDPDRAKWTGPYLTNEQGMLDAWGHPFQYNPTPIHNVSSYDLWSLGPNGIDESSDGDDDDGDDIANWHRDAP